MILSERANKALRSSVRVSRITRGIFRSDHPLFNQLIS